MIGYSEAVRFVSHHLNEVQDRGIFRQFNRLIFPPLYKDYLFFLGDCRDSLVFQAKIVQRRNRGRKLPLASVDQHKIG